MIIKSIKIKGFKGFKDEYFLELDEEETTIMGENFQGKTSIGEAICWCLLGCNLFGNDKTANIINENSREAYCELKFEDNEGIEHTIIRIKGRENIVALDGRQATVEMLSKFYFNKKVFLSIYNPYYFSSLEPKDQRELLRSVLPVINYKDAFDLLSPGEKDILVEPRMDLNTFIKNARADVKELDKEEQNLEGKIQYAKSIAVSHIGNEKVFDKEELLANYEREYENVLKSINGDTKKEMTHRLKEVDELLDKYNKILQELITKYNENKAILDDVKRDSSICPLCQNPIINSEKVEKIIKTQTEILKDIEKKGKETREEIKRLNGQKSILDIKCNKLNRNEIKEDLLLSIQNKISILKIEKESIQKYNYDLENQKKTVDKANNDIVVFSKALEEIRNEREILKTQIAVATSLNFMIVKKQMDMVKSYLNRVKIVFSKVDEETGEIKDDYKIFYDDKEFNVLSLSEKIRATLEISNLINKIVGLNAPTFIDNAESITHYNNEFDNQVIIAAVVKDQELFIKRKLRLVI